MRSLKYYFTLTCSVMLILGLSALSQAQELLGQWTFEPGKELVDLAGNFGDIELQDKATIKDGQLVLGTDCWAITSGYEGPDIEEKTLLAWLYIDDLDITHGAPIGIQQTSMDSFDAIVYAERQPRSWMAGSSNFQRTQDFDPGFEEKETGELVYMAISYEDKGGAHIIGYRNGEVIGEYAQGAIATWEAGDVEAIFGIRACFIGFGGAVYGWVGEHVDEARIYGEVLSQKEIEDIHKSFLAVTPGGKLTTLWGAVKAE